jgi:hypothetical protein
MDWMKPYRKTLKHLYTDAERGLRDHAALRRHLSAVMASTARKNRLMAVKNDVMTALTAVADPAGGGTVVDARSSVRFLSGTDDP